MGHPWEVPPIDTSSQPGASGTGTEPSMLGGGREGARGRQSKDALLPVCTYGVGDRGQGLLLFIVGFWGEFGGSFFF